jgi:hypothetical protein
MTCIALKNGFMAWDSQDTIFSTDPSGIGTMKWAGSIKGFKDEGLGIIVAFSGEAYACAALQEWLFTGRQDRPNVLKNESAEALVLHRDGRVESIDCFGRVIVLDPKVPYAAGSGMSAAMAAMLAGCDAGMAVDIASMVDPYTGGKIHVEHW